MYFFQPLVSSCEAAAEQRSVGLVEVAVDVADCWLRDAVGVAVGSSGSLMPTQPRDSGVTLASAPLRKSHSRR